MHTHTHPHLIIIIASPARRSGQLKETQNKQTIVFNYILLVVSFNHLIVDYVNDGQTAYDVVHCQSILFMLINIRLFIMKAYQ